MRLPRSFTGRLALIALAGLVVRLAWVWYMRHYTVQGDALVYHLDAQHVADGLGFRRAFEVDEPTAEHPPLFIVLLAGFDLLGATGFNAHRVLLTGIGTTTVVLIGLLGRTVLGDRVGLIAAALASAYPLLWAMDASLMSEVLYAPLITLTILAAFWHLRAPSWRKGAAVGALIALAALTRGEAIGLLGLLAFPLAWSSAGAWRPRLARFAVIVAAFVVVIAPWSVRNLMTFEEPILISTNGYGVFIGANCDKSYYGPQIGSWAYTCFTDRLEGDESEYSVDYRDRGLRYMADHADRLPLVMAARFGRLWDVFRPQQAVFFMATEGRHSFAARAGIKAYWLILPLAVAGALVLRLRRVRFWPLLAPIGLVTLMGVFVYGSTRFRVAAEPMLLVLAAVSLDTVWRSMRAPRPAPGDDAVEREPERVPAAA